MTLSTLPPAARAPAAPPSGTIVRLAQLLGSEINDPGKLVDVIAEDAALRANVLRAANAAANGNQLRVRSVSRAVALLGSRKALHIGFQSYLTAHRLELTRERLQHLEGLMQDASAPSPSARAA